MVFLICGREFKEVMVTELPSKSLYVAVKLISLIVISKLFSFLSSSVTVECDEEGPDSAYITADAHTEIGSPLDVPCLTVSIAVEPIEVNVTVASRAVFPVLGVTDIVTFPGPVELVLLIVHHELFEEAVHGCPLDIPVTETVSLPACLKNESSYVDSDIAPSFCPACVNNWSKR